MTFKLGHTAARCARFPTYNGIKPRALPIKINGCASDGNLQNG